MVNSFSSKTNNSVSIKQGNINKQSNVADSDKQLFTPTSQIKTENPVIASPNEKGSDTSTLFSASAIKPEVKSNQTPRAAYVEAKAQALNLGSSAPTSVNNRTNKRQLPAEEPTKRQRTEEFYPLTTNLAQKNVNKQSSTTPPNTQQNYVNKTIEVRAILANRDKYEGDWLNGQRHGKGIETYFNVGKYEGNFQIGQRHGEGVLTYTNGKKALIQYNLNEWVKGVQL